LEWRKAHVSRRTPGVLPPPNQGTLAVPRVGERELAAMRSANEPEFVDNVGGEQGLRDRDMCVDADIASPLLLEIPNEFDQPGVDHRGIWKAGVRSRIATLLDGQPTVAARRELGVAVTLL
jgi:hypothetical protein